VPEFRETEYEQRAASELQALLDALDRIGEEVEAELSSGVLTLEFGDAARYVVNSQRAARQIWLAAERSAWHFDWHEARAAWVSTKTGEELWDVLGRLVVKKLGRPVDLSRSG
jgi:CyaY protein